MSLALLESFVSATFIGGAAGYLGSLMLSRQMALVAGPLGHLTLPGVAIAMLLGFDVSLGAFPFVILGVVAIWLLEKKTRLPMESLTALVFASGVAIAFLLLPLDRAEAALVGDVSKAGAGDTLISAVASLAVILTVNRVYPKLVLGSISEELAASEGIDVRRFDLLYLLLIAVMVSLGVKMVGGLLTVALVAIPAAAARNIGKNLKQYALGAAFVGVTSGALGILLFRLSGLPAGPLIVLASTAMFLVTLPFAG